MENNISLLDNDAESAHIGGFFDDLLEEVKAPFDTASLVAAVKKRARQDARRLNNWTGERYVKVEAAD